MLVITFELNAELILFAAPIQKGAEFMYSQHMGSAHCGKHPAGICKRR